jgi:peptidoglycan/LPS O-acetylase OafA/YrhL
MVRFAASEAGGKMANTYTRLNFIDSWRTVAVLFVILAHLSLNHEVKAIYSSSPLLNFLSGHGETGVYIFFFISGYVVSRTCIAEFSATREFSMSGFYIRRVFRIVPPLLIYLSVCLLLGFFDYISFTASQFVPASLYFCNNKLVNCGWFAGHTWSLAFEEQFYLVFPMMFSLINLGRRSHPLAFFAAAVILIIPFLWPVHYIGRTGFIIIHVLFSLGYILARYPKIFPQNQAIVTLLFLVSAIVTFLPVGDLSASDAADKLALGKYYKFVFIISIPAMVMSTSVLGTAINMAFNNGILAYLGRASYSVYLWQQLATGAWPEAPLSTQAAITCIMVVGCLLLYEVIEKRLIRTGRQLASRQSQLLAERVSRRPLLQR